MNIIRIREEGCPKINSGCKTIYFPRKAEYDTDLFNKMICDVIDAINDLCGTDVHITPRLADDAVCIRNMMMLKNAA